MNASPAPLFPANLPANTPAMVAAEGTRNLQIARPEDAAFSADLASFLDPVVFARTRLGLLTSPWQTKFLRSTARKVVLNCARQSGKTTCVAILAAHTAYRRPRSKIIIAAPSSRQSEELLLAAKRMYRDGVDTSGEAGSRATRDSAMELRLLNGSRLIALPGDNAKTVRGISAPDLVLIDEAAFVANDLFVALLPMLDRNPRAKLVLLSTPSAKEGYFFERWEDPNPEWLKIRVSWRDNTHFTPEMAEERKRELGAFRFAREYECRFSENETSIFADSSIERAFVGARYLNLKF